MILIDANPILYRSSSVYSLTTSRGVPSGVVYGSIKILQSLARQLDSKLEDLVIFWDLGRSRYRTARYPAYKNTPGRTATREKAGVATDAFANQRRAVHEVLAAKGVRQVQVRGVEADDLIAIATTTGAHTVVSDDHDLWQLVGQNGTQVYAPVRKTWIRNRDDCYRALGLYPEQIAAYKAICGDPSDGIPGVPGLGDKTAKAILAVVAGLPELYARLRSGEQVPVGERLAKVLLEEVDHVRLWFDLCQPLDWSMLSPEEQAGFLAGWQGPVRADRTVEYELYQTWELHEFSRNLAATPWNHPEPTLERFNAIVHEGHDCVRDGRGVGETIRGSIAWQSAPTDVGNWHARLASIAAQVVTCYACTMRAECSLPVPCNIEDPTERPWAMIVGRNPGATEDKEGRGFVGPAGRRLDRFLVGQDSNGKQVQGALLDRKKAIITNVCKCFSLGNRAPENEEIATCVSRFLREEIRAVQPRLILSFGAQAMLALTGHTDSIMQRAGTTVSGTEVNGLVQYAMLDGGERRYDPVIPPECTIVLLPHPAAALRAGQAEAKLQMAGRAVEQWLNEKS